MASRSLTTFAGRSSWCRSSLGPCRPTHSADVTTAAHLTTAADRLANLTHAVAARLSLTVTTWKHVYRRVLRELDIEFESTRLWTRQFLRSLQLSWKLAATCTRERPSEADIARERKLLQLRVIYLCDRFGISQDRIWNLDETAVRIVPTGRAQMDQEGRSSPCLRFARLRHGHACCKHERRYVDTDRLRGDERPSTPSWTSVPLPARVTLPNALDHAGRSLGHDRRDRRGHARTPW